jgi:hypothetical protein
MQNMLEMGTMRMQLCTEIVCAMLAADGVRFYDDGRKSDDGLQEG